ncbi:hypothetical protein FACS1894159_05190 [Bacteroidia bacterium]|nr:hypothetical protein FACS1894159_05190 [Bacteroidia bacterium]
MSVCGLTITFTYDYNMARVDKFRTDVDKVELYAFDETGTLVDKYDADFTGSPGNEMKIELDTRKFTFPGNYTFVAWCDLADKLNVLNSSSLSVMSVALRDVGTVAYERQPEKVFWGRIDNVPLKRMDNQKQNISLMKGTNNISVKLNGLPYATRVSVEPEFVVRVVSKNYEFHNTHLLSVAARGGNVLYGAKYDYTGQSSNVLNSNFNIMRMFKNGDCASHLVVYHTPANPNAPVEVLYDESLVDLCLAPTRMGGTRTDAEDQEYLDRQDQHSIELTFDRTYQVVKIVVDDYVVHDSSSNGGTLG